MQSKVQPINRDCPVLTGTPKSRPIRCKKCDQPLQHVSWAEIRGDAKLFYCVSENCLFYGVLRIDKETIQEVNIRPGYPSEAGPKLWEGYGQLA